MSLEYAPSGNYCSDQGLTATTLGWVGQPTFRLGNGGAGDSAGIFAFQLPTLEDGETITDANLDAMLESINTWSETDLPAHVDVYGLGFRSSPAVQQSDFHVGSLDTTDATLIQDNFAVRTTTPGQLSTDSTGDANLVDYLNAQYAAGGAGQYVFLRLSPDATVPTSYRYYTFSTADNATSANRPVLTVTIEDSSVPVAPDNLSAFAVSTSQIELTWNDNSTNETGFGIERSSDGVNFTQIATIAADETDYRDNNLDYDTTYYYRIRALGQTQHSEYTSVVSDTTDDLQPLVVSNAMSGTSYADQSLTATALGAISHGSFRVGNGGSGDTAGVLVFQLPELEFGQSIANANFSAMLENINTWSQTDLPANVDIYGLGFRNSPAVELSDFYVGSLDTTDATLIQDNFAVRTTTPGQLSTDSTGDANLVDYLNAQYAAGGAGKYVFLRLTLDATVPTTYRYYNFSTADNATSANWPSLTLQLTTAVPNIPDAPSNLQATAASSTQIDLAWTDNSDDEIGFVIQRSPDGLHFSNYDFVGANVTSYSDTVAPSSTWYYRVAAADDAVSEFTTGAEATTPAFDGIAAPSNFVATVTSDADIQLTWSDDFSTETGYEIQRSTDGINFSALASVGANVTSYSETSLTADTTYHYRVRANFAAEDSNFTVLETATLPDFINTYWVDISASGSLEDGSYANPYLSINAAVAQAGPGDGVVIREGEYHEKLQYIPNGTSSLPFTLMGAPGERAVVTGLEDITGWQQYQDDIYVTTLNWEPEYLYVGNTIQALSREPNEGWFIVPTLTDNGDGTMSFTDAENLAGIDSLVGKSLTLALHWGVNYTSTQIVGHDTQTGELTVNAVSNAVDHLAAGDLYMIKNSPYFLDEVGEWAVVDNGDGTYNVYFWAENVSDLSATRSNRDTSQQIRLHDVHYVNIRDLEVSGNSRYGVHVGGWSTHVNLSGLVVHSNLGSGIHVRGAEYVTVSNCFATANGNAGVEMLSTHHGVIQNCELAYNRVEGILVGGDISGAYPNGDPNNLTWDITVQNNYIHHQLLWNHPDGIQIYLGVSDLKILNNLIMGCGHGVMSQEVDGAVLAGNVILGSASTLTIFGHGNSNDWEIYDNTLGLAGYESLRFTGTDYDVHDNVIFGSINVGDNNNWTSDHNLFWVSDTENILMNTDTWTAYNEVEDLYAAMGQEQNSLIADPLYANVPEGYTTVCAIDDIQASTATTLKVDSVADFSVGDFIELNFDGVVREVTAIDAVNGTITFDVPLPCDPTRYVTVANWGDRNDFQIDLTMDPTSPAATLGTYGGTVGSQINVAAYQAGDFDGDGVRDLPEYPADVVASIPDPNDWFTPSYFPTY